MTVSLQNVIYIKKAFNSVDYNLIFATLTKVEFGENFAKYVKVLLNGVPKAVYCTSVFRVGYSISKQVEDKETFSSFCCWKFCMFKSEQRIDQIF